MISFVRHLFVPHHSNNHRPKLLHHKSLLILILVIITIASWMPLVRKAAPNVLGIATNINASDLLSFTNQKRQEEGLPPLVINSELVSAAGSKASYMFAKDYWAHNAPDGTTPWVFFQNAGYGYVYAGENLAKDFNDSEGVVAAWMASPSHRDNMLSAKYDEIGFAIVNGTLNGSETTLVVEMLGRRQGGSIAAVPSVLPPPAGGPTIAPVVEVIPTASLPTVATQLVTPTPVRIVRETQSLPPAFIAGVTSNPLIDSQMLTRRAAITILGLITLAFISDLIYIERRNIVRLVGHNSDHILFLAGAIGLLVLFGRGVVL